MRDAPTQPLKTVSLVIILIAMLINASAAQGPGQGGGAQVCPGAVSKPVVTECHAKEELTDASVLCAPYFIVDGYPQLDLESSVFAPSATFKKTSRMDDAAVRRTVVNDLNRLLKTMPKLYRFALDTEERDQDMSSELKERHSKRSQTREVSGLKGVVA